MYMTKRERALAVFEYKQPDVPVLDLMENTTWPELDAYFKNTYNLGSTEEILSFLDCDFRWCFSKMPSDGTFFGEQGTFSDDVGLRPLQGVETVRELDRKYNPDPGRVSIPDFKGMRDKFPQHGLIFCLAGLTGFSSACMQFGMMETLINTVTNPEVLQAYAIKRAELSIEVMNRGIAAGAREYCDFLWLGDDFASEKTLILSPDSWRKIFKPALAKQVRAAREVGFYVMLHSCGAVSEVYKDLIEIGVNCHIGVQTSAANMSMEYLAQNFGGEIIIFGGIDAQTTLIHGTPMEVEEEVKRNLSLFEKCGGYIVSNSHHTLADMPGENIVAMARACGRM